MSKKTKHVNFRIDEEMYSKLMKYVKEEDKPLSAFIREVLCKKINCD